MNRPARKLEWIIWGGLFLVMLAILVAFVAAQLRSKPLPILGQLSEFALTDQDGQPASLDHLLGQVWVTDVIFTRCPGQCLRMTKQMSELQAALPAGEPIKLVSLTADPGFDTPSVLKKYGERFSAKPGWLFLSGDKHTINQIAVDGLKLVVADNPPAKQENPDDLFVHSTKFVLIDQRGQVRGYFEGEDAVSRPQIITAIKKLLREKN